MSDTKDLIPVLPEESHDRAHETLFMFAFFYMIGSAGGICFYHFLSVPFDLHPSFHLFFDFSEYIKFFAYISFPYFLILFLSTSLLGVYCMPFVFILRGFSVTICTSAILCSSTSVGNALLAIGLTAFFSLCGMFFVIEDAFDFSAALRKNEMEKADAVRCLRVFPGLLFIAVSAACRTILKIIP